MTANGGKKRQERAGKAARAALAALNEIRSPGR